MTERTSELERWWRNFFIRYFYRVEFEYNTRPDWLVNPKTGHNLELDLYNEKYKLAIEIDGDQHYKYTPVFHKSREDFKDQVKRDKLKDKLCKKMGVKLFLITTSSTKLDVYTDIKDYIREVRMSR